MPRITESVLARYRRPPLDPYWPIDDVCELQGRYRPAPAYVENVAGGPLILEDEHIRVHHIVDIDVIADRTAVFVRGWDLSLLIAEAEDAARARIRVEDRLPWTLDDAVAQGDGRNGLPAAQVDSDHLRGVLRHAVRVLWVRDPFRGGLHLQRTATLGQGLPTGRRRGHFRGAFQAAAPHRRGSQYRPSPIADCDDATTTRVMSRRSAAIIS